MGASRRGWAAAVAHPIIAPAAACVSRPALKLP